MSNDADDVWRRDEAPPAGVPSRAALLELAPGHEIRARRTRYVGDSVTVSIAALTARDAAIVRELYAFLNELRELSLDQRQRGHATLSVLADFLHQKQFSSLADRCASLGVGAGGVGTSNEGQNLLLRKVFHDIRGGSLASLVAHLDLVETGEAMPKDVERILALAQDHRKILRNAIHDLDTSGHADDLQFKEHTVELLQRKWSAVEYRLPDATARVIVDCDFSGSVSDFCMEFSSLDRILYNLVNNAARNTADGLVHMAIFPLDDAPQTQLRFAIMNRVTTAQRELLRQRFGSHLGKMFEGGFTTGGHGIGMRICGDFITHSYGLESLQQALDRRYLGVELVADAWFVAWFHWPARRKGKLPA